MRVGVIDVGSNTVRLLVADVVDGRVASVARKRAYLGLGGEIARHGRISPDGMARTADVTRAYAMQARRRGADVLRTFVTAPGRQGAGAGAFATALREATGAAVQVLTAEEEGRLAFEGAVARAAAPAEVVGVVDVGGGSTEIVVGVPSSGDAWVRSLDVGSLRLVDRHFDGDPPSRTSLARARDEVRRGLEGLVPPRPDEVLAVGGTARAVGRLVGRRFGPDELEEVVARAARRSARETSKRLGLELERARTIAAGAIALAEVARLLDRPFTLARGGLREGAALALASALDVAA